MISLMILAIVDYYGLTSLVSVLESMPRHRGHEIEVEDAV